jgi:hypothetical protein
VSDLDEAFERFAHRFRAIESQVPSAGDRLERSSPRTRSVSPWALVGAISGIALLGAVITIGPWSAGPPPGSGQGSSASPEPSPSTLAVGATLSPPPSGPPVECDREPEGYTIDAQGSEIPIPVRLTCADAVRAALIELGDRSGAVSIEFHYGAYCPPGEFCVFTDINRGYVVLHPRIGPASTVEVFIDAKGHITTSVIEPYPPYTPVPASSPRG